MPRAVDLFKQGKREELWQMCCGFLSLNINEFMDVQNRLMLQQLELLNNCQLGHKIMQDARPQTVEEFRQQVPLTTYKEYCPELLEKKDDTLPVKAEQWVHTSGRSGEYPCKWVPITYEYAWEMSKALYGIGMLSCCKDWGDTSNIPNNINILYSVAPRPYISGTFADLLRMQWPFNYLPPLEEAEDMSFEDRIRLGFQQAMSQGFDYFFGLSLVLANVGDKIRESSNNFNVRPFLKRPRALWRLTRGKVKSLMARRAMLPRDLWSVRGIIGSGVDSWVYRDKIQKLWGRKPLDLYSCTEGGVIATQTWDYDGMTFVPQLNFLEFIPEDEQLKWQMDRSYKPQTLLLNEVKAGETYEIVFTNFHGGAMVRYRLGDIIGITSLKNEKLGIDIPQMVFERRADDLINFTVIKLTEKQIWQALEKTGIEYEDWVAYKIPGEPVLNLLFELKNGIKNNDKLNITENIYRQLVESGKDSYQASGVPEDWRDELDFSVDVTLLPEGTFARYTEQRQSEGADLAHIKPPHINPPEKVISTLKAELEETIIVTKSREKVMEEDNPEKIKTP
jgi:hypothetical protein